MKSTLSRLREEIKRIQKNPPRKSYLVDELILKSINRLQEKASLSTVAVETKISAGNMSRKLRVLESEGIIVIGEPVHKVKRLKLTRKGLFLLQAYCEDKS